MLAFGATAMMRKAGNSRRSKSHSAGRFCDSSKAINRKSGLVSATSAGTSCSFFASPTTRIPDCSASVESTSSLIRRGRLATSTRTFVSMRSSLKEQIRGTAEGGQTAKRTGGQYQEHRTPYALVRDKCGTLFGTRSYSKDRRL